MGIPDFEMIMRRDMGVFDLRGSQKVCREPMHVGTIVWHTSRTVVAKPIERVSLQSMQKVKESHRRV